MVVMVLTCGNSVLNEEYFMLSDERLPDWVRELADVYTPGSGFVRFEVDPHYEL